MSEHRTEGGWMQEKAAELRRAARELRAYEIPLADTCSDLQPADRDRYYRQSLRLRGALETLAQAFEQAAGGNAAPGHPPQEPAERGRRMQTQEHLDALEVQARSVMHRLQAMKAELLQDLPAEGDGRRLLLMNCDQAIRETRVFEDAVRQCSDALMAQEALGRMERMQIVYGPPWAIRNSRRRG